MYLGSLPPFTVVPSSLVFQRNNKLAIGDMRLIGDLEDEGESRQWVTARLSLVWQVVFLGVLLYWTSVTDTIIQWVTARLSLVGQVGFLGFFVRLQRH